MGNNISSAFLNRPCGVQIAKAAGNATLLNLPTGATECLQLYYDMDLVRLGFTGDLFADALYLPPNRKVSLSPAERIKVILTFDLNGGPTIDIANYSFPSQNWNGLGHLVFRRKAHHHHSAHCSSLQLALDTLTISSNNIATATYEGFVEQSVTLNSRYKINLDVTFMLNLMHL